MWKKLSLRTRLFLPLGLMFIAVLLAGGVALQMLAPIHLMDEHEPAELSTKAVANALNSALYTSANPQATLDAFVQALGTSEAIHFRPADIPASVHPPIEVQTPPGRVPRWFVELIGAPATGTSFPVTVGEKRVGDIVFVPDLSADLFEKWIVFLAMACSAIAFLVLTSVIAYFSAGAAIRPLRNLGEGLTRMREGDYAHPIPASGPLEIRRSCEEANELARTLHRLSQDNRNLLRKIVSLQDDERRDIARELHDELGPLLFGIRANTVALLEAVPQDQAGLDGPAKGILHSVGALQQANRRVLERLRPLHIQELGLERSIQTLLRNAQTQVPGLKLKSHIDPRLNAVDGLLSQTIYRVIQEGVTNVLRHAGAGAMNVEAALSDGELIVEISDDGVGFPSGRKFGRGLTGMQERARALSGTLEVLREDGRTRVRCRLPIGDATLGAASTEQA
jgi:two-component system, NarL family, sensor histidine kinase UhpB